MAYVYSVDYVDPSRYQPNGSWDVVYTYRVNGEIYTGRYKEAAGSPTETYSLKPDDTLEISYNPSHPDRNFNPLLDVVSFHGFAPWLIGAAIALASGLLTVFSHHSR